MVDRYWKQWETKKGWNWGNNYKTGRLGADLIYVFTPSFVKNN